MLAPDLPSGRQDAATVLVRIAREGEGLLGELVDRYHPSLLRLARAALSGAAGVEKLANETWLALVDEEGDVSGRTFRAWLFRLLVDRARRQAERRGSPLDLSAPSGPSLPAGRFRGAEDRYAGNWTAPPQAWPPGSEARCQPLLAAALARLPAGPRLAFTLRDVERCEPAEACDVLRVAESTERRLLHAARSAVRAALEEGLANP